MFASRLLAGWVWDALSWCRTQYDVSLLGYGWSDWLKQFSAAAPIKECYCVRRRRTQSIPQGAVTNVVARLPSMLRRFLPDSSHSFGWSHICAVFVAILNFTLWGNTHARIHCHVVNCFPKAKCDEDQACARGYQRLLKTGPISEENLSSKFNLSVKWVPGV